MKRLGNRTETTLRATCLDEMIQVQSMLERAPVLPWWLISEQETATLTANDRRLAVPTGFLREVEEEASDEEGSLIVVDTQGNEIPLPKDTYANLARTIGTQATADVPQAYALVGQYFMMFPIPNLALSVKIRCYLADQVIGDNNTENGWLKNASDLLIAKTGLVMGGQHIVVPADKMAAFASAVQEATARIAVENIARAEASMKRASGED